MSPSREELLAWIAEEEARLAGLERQREEARARLEALRQELAATPSPPAATRHLPVGTGTAAASSPTEKVRLFRKLFRVGPGRCQVYQVVDSCTRHGARIAGRGNASRG